MGNVAGLVLSISGVLVAAVAYWNRDKPAWQHDLRAIMVLAIGQVALGVVASLLIR